MKKTAIFSIAALALTSIGGATSVFAQDGGTYKTDDTITFKQGSGPVDPVDPIDPDKPITPVDPPKPVGDSLTIDYASNFDFGEQVISTDTKEYYAKLDRFKDANGGQEVENLNYVQVTDLRGTLAGWNLSVSQVGQFKTAEGDELTGAVIDINQANLISAVKDGSVDAYKPGTVSNTLSLNPDGSTSKAVSAAEKQGPGTWVYRFGNDLNDSKTAVKLTVPGKTIKLAKQYTTNLNWTLADTPANP